MKPNRGKSEDLSGQLKKTSAFLEGVLETVKEVVFVIGPPGRMIMHANSMVEYIFGFKPSEVEGHSVEMLHASSDSFIAFRRQIDQALATGGAFQGVYRMRRRNGNIFPTEHRITVLNPEAGWPGAVVSVVRDISEKEAVRKQLDKSEEKYRSILENANEGVVVLLEKTIAYANPQASKLVDLRVDELVGSAYRSFVHPNDLSFIESLIKQLLNGEEVVKNFEFRLRNRDITRWVRGNAVALRWDDQMAVMTLLTDFEEQKQMQQAHQEMQTRLQQAQKMEAIGSLAGGIAHDFNNILFPIVGLAEMLMEDLPKGTLSYENAREIFGAGKRGSDLVKQILTFSRQTEHRKLPVHIQKILKEVIKLARSTIPSDIEIRSGIQIDCSAVMADPTQIHQIAMNLITNAYHAVAPQHGTIKIDLREVTLEGNDWAESPLLAGRYAKMTVADTGGGIAPGILPKIFEPYFTTKSPDKGTGLGLAVVYGIVKEHHGDIQVVSEPGQGATFRVYLPLLEKAAEEMEVYSRVLPYETGSERILLVDDEQAIVRMETRMLETLGYRVESRLSSLEALAAFKARPKDFDLVITDVTMPQMTGDQLARELIAVRPDIPVILCTGFSERINPHQLKAMGIKGFLLKPIVKSDLAAMVRQALEA